MPIRGKLVISAILTAALCASGLAWWMTYRQGQRILQLWGAETAHRIRMAPDCELLALERAGEGASFDLVSRHGRWQIHRQVDLSHAPGFVHARQALIEDNSYRWDVATDPSDAANWRYALRFRDATGETILAFDLDLGWVLDVEQNRAADIQVIAPGLSRYFREQLESASDPPDEPS